jgi:hypothetical protein
MTIRRRIFARPEPRPRAPLAMHPESHYNRVVFLSRLP